MIKEIETNTKQGDFNHKSHLEKQFFKQMKIRSTHQTKTNITQLDADLIYQQKSHRRLQATSIKTYEEFRECVSQPNIMYPCWGAHIVKNYPVEQDWGESQCCHYLGHNSHCSPDVHYCVDELDEKGTTRLPLTEDIDYFSNYITFHQYLDFVMATPPPDEGICGLDGFGENLPFVNLKQGGDFELQIGPTSYTNDLPKNTVCKVRINSKIAYDGTNGTGDQKIIFQFGKIPEYIRSVYLVGVNEKIRLNISNSQKFRDSLNSWPIFKNMDSSQLSFTDADNIQNTQFWLVYQPTSPTKFNKDEFVNAKSSFVSSKIQQKDQESVENSGHGSDVNEEPEDQINYENTNSIVYNQEESVQTTQNNIIVNSTDVQQPVNQINSDCPKYKCFEDNIMIFAALSLFVFVFFVLSICFFFKLKSIRQQNQYINLKFEALKQQCEQQGIVINPLLPSLQDQNFKHDQLEQQRKNTLCSAGIVAHFQNEFDDEKLANFKINMEQQIQLQVMSAVDMGSPVGSKSNAHQTGSQVIDDNIVKQPEIIEMNCSTNNINLINLRKLPSLSSNVQTIIGGIDLNSAVTNDNKHEFLQNPNYTNNIRIDQEKGHYRVMSNNLQPQSLPMNFYEHEQYPEDTDRSSSHVSNQTSRPILNNANYINDQQDSFSTQVQVLKQFNEKKHVNEISNIQMTDSATVHGMASLMQVNEVSANNIRTKFKKAQLQQSKGMPLIASNVVGQIQIDQIGASNNFMD